jgi:hypothetical protein
LPTLNRPDIKAVVIANDRKAGRADTLPTDDLYAIHPGFYQDLAPATTLLREPMVATWREEGRVGVYHFSPRVILQSQTTAHLMTAGVVHGHESDTPRE